MSLVAYVNGALIADRNCEEYSRGIQLNQTPMQKIHISKCGSLAVGHSGDWIDPERIDYLMNLLIVKLRSHQMENEDSVFLSSVVIQNAADLFNLDNNSWYVMTHDDAYQIQEEMLLPLTKDQVVASGTLGTPYHTYIMNGFDPKTAIERTLRIMPTAVTEYDYVEQSSLQPLFISANAALEVIAAIKLLEEVKEA